MKSLLEFINALLQFSLILITVLVKITRFAKEIYNCHALKRKTLFTLLDDRIFFHFCFAYKMLPFWGFINHSLISKYPLCFAII